MVASQVAVSGSRERILEAAERLVSEIGAARLTLDAVAHSAGISKGGLLYHYPSKEALLSALAQRYVRHLRGCIEHARGTFAAGEIGGDLKACVLGVLGDDPRSKELGAALLATAAHDPTLLQVIRAHLDEQTQALAQNANAFARAAVVELAVDGLTIRESLRISTLNAEQRAAIVQELLKLADEAYRS